MARRGSSYTKIGHKIAKLAVNQAEIAEILQLTQQSVSGKLTGKIAISIEDLVKLSDHFKVDVIYFFLPIYVEPEAANVLADAVWDETTAALTSSIHGLDKSDQNVVNALVTALHACREKGESDDVEALKEENADLKAQVERLQAGRYKLGN